MFDRFLPCLLSIICWLDYSESYRYSFPHPPIAMYLLHTWAIFWWKNPTYVYFVENKHQDFPLLLRMLPNIWKHNKNLHLQIHSLAYCYNLYCMPPFFVLSSIVIFTPVVLYCSDASHNFLNHIGTFGNNMKPYFWYCDIFSDWSTTQK